VSRPNDRDENPNHRHVTVAVRHGLRADLNDADHRYERAQKPKPTDQHERPAPYCYHSRSGDHRDDRGPTPVDWHGRGIDQGRFDHQAFNWMGQQVNPLPAGNGNGWGFWFLGQWIPL
jgi:hypothetical protein